MTNQKTLFEQALDVVNRNESLYNHWENEIAAYMAKRWPDAYALTQKETGSDEPTALEMADMGAAHVSDQAAFVGDLNQVFRTLAKGCALNRQGDWV